MSRLLVHGRTSHVQDAKETHHSGEASLVMFTKLVAVLAKHYKPKPSEIMERFKFHSRSHTAGESVGKYMAEL